MNWLNILLLSLLSLPVALAAVFGLFRSKGLEVAVWLVIGLGIAWALRSAPKPFLSAFACGLLMGFWQHLINIALWNTYVTRNSQVAAQIITAASEKNLSPQLFMLFSAPMVGLIYGVVIALLAWGASKLSH